MVVLRISPYNDGHRYRGVTLAVRTEDLEADLEKVKGILDMTEAYALFKSKGAGKKDYIDENSGRRSLGVLIRGISEEEDGLGSHVAVSFIPSGEPGKQTLKRLLTVLSVQEQHRRISRVPEYGDIYS